MSENIPPSNEVTGDGSSETVHQNQTEILPGVWQTPREISESWYNEAKASAHSSEMDALFDRARHFAFPSP